MVWCHDVKGFNAEDRTRQLVDKLAETTGWAVILPDFIGEVKDAKDDAEFFTKICDWSKLHDFWVEKLWPYMRDELKVQALGAVGTGWGSWVATRYTLIIHDDYPLFEPKSLGCHPMRRSRPVSTSSP